MCQIGDKRLHAHTVTCYRAYQRTDEGFESYYKGYPKPENGKIIVAEEEPFHAFRSKTAVNKWAKNGVRDTSAIFECELSGSLMGGKWSGEESVATVTGNKLKIIRQVGKINSRGKVIWNNYLFSAKEIAHPLK